jgi:hypothetical protein
MRWIPGGVKSELENSRVGKFMMLGNEDRMQSGTDGKVGVFEGTENEFARDAEVVHLEATENAVGDVGRLEEKLFGCGPVRGSVPEGGIDAAGEEGSDTNAVRSGFFSEALSETTDAPFGGAIDGFTGDTAEAGGGDDVNDVTVFVGDHGTEGGLGAEDGAFQIDVQHEVDFLLGVIGNPAMAGESSVVDPNGDGAETCFGSMGKSGDGRGLGDIAGKGEDVIAAEGLACVFQSGLIDIGEDDIHACVEEGGGGGEADALSGTGNDGSLVFEVHGGELWRGGGVCQWGVGGV